MKPKRKYNYIMKAKLAKLLNKIIIRLVKINNFYRINIAFQI